MSINSIVNSKSTAGLGVALMLLGCFVFSLNDTLGKWLVATYSVGQLLLIRSIAAMLVLAPFLMRGGVMREFRQASRPGLQVLRIVLSSCEVGLFYWAVAYLPLLISPATAVLASAIDCIIGAMALAWAMPGIWEKSIFQSPPSRLSFKVWPDLGVTVALSPSIFTSASASSLV